MRKLKTPLIVTFVLLCVVGIVFYGVPLGSGVTTIENFGQRGNGDEILAKTIHDDRLFPISPEGFLYRTYLEYIVFYERTGSKETALPFLFRDRYEYEVLKPILPVKGSNKWVAFRLMNVGREKVDLFLCVFDRKRVRHTFEIKNVIRVSTCADGWSNADSYSVSQSPTDGTITINTLDGLVTYDQSFNKLIIDRAPISKLGS